MFPHLEDPADQCGPCAGQSWRSSTNRSSVVTCAPHLEDTGNTWTLQSTTGYTDRVHRQGTQTGSLHCQPCQAVTQMWGYSGSDLEIIRRMYKLDENISTEIIILPKFYIILVIKFFTFYQIFQFTWEHLECQNIFFIKENQFQKCFSFPKIFLLSGQTVHSIKGGRETERLMIEMRDKITSLGALVVVCPVCFRNFGNFGFKNVKKKWKWR